MSNPTPSPYLPPEPEYSPPPPRPLGKVIFVVVLVLAIVVSGVAFAGFALRPADTPTPDASSSPSASVSLPPASSLDEFYSQTLSWESCEKAPECAWLTVPLSYEDLSAGSIRLRVSRVPAEDNTLGSLVVNPGGPGGTGVDFAESFASGIAPSVAAAYDIVGFDPRGVGESSPITCLTGEQTTEYIRQDGTPDSPGEVSELIALGERTRAGCQGDPLLASSIGSENTARDMDILRSALGDPLLNWAGFSYGTYLGIRYAEQFPDKVGRMVLDGVVDPFLTGEQMGADQAAGFEDAFARFAADCVTHDDCPFSPDADAVIAGMNSILAGLDESPLPAGDRTLTQSEGLTGMILAMYAPSIWPMLRTALADAKAGDGGSLLYLADFANHRIGPDEYESNSLSAFLSISCWDFPVKSPSGSFADEAEAAAASSTVPELAVMLAWGSEICSSWKETTSYAPSVPLSTTSAPILLIGTRHDPATPLKWAEAAAKALPTAFLLVYEGDGHTAYDESQGSSCVSDVASAYLLTGQLPDSSPLTCGA